MHGHSGSGDLPVAAGMSQSRGGMSFRAREESGVGWPATNRLSRSVPKRQHIPRTAPRPHQMPLCVGMTPHETPAS